MKLFTSLALSLPLILSASSAMAGAGYATSKGVEIHKTTYEASGCVSGSVYKQTGESSKEFDACHRVNIQHPTFDHHTRITYVKDGGTTTYVLEGDSEVVRIELHSHDGDFARI